MDLSLSKASNSDFEFLLNLRLKTMDTHLRNAGLFLTEEQHRNRVKEKFELSHIIRADGLNIGLVKFEETATSITIFQIQILPEFQGKGYGKSILKNLISKARNKIACLSVLKENPALRLYQSLGFTIVDEDNYEYHLEYKR